MSLKKAAIPDVKVPAGLAQCPDLQRLAHRSSMTKANRGFTLIEMLVVIAIIAILALIALPSYQSRIVRKQIIEGAGLANVAKPPIAAAWSATKTLPVDNAAAALPAADKIVSDLVSKVTVQDGAIHITYGNSANSVLKGKVLTMRPAVVEDAPIVPVTWVCGSAAPPDKMTLKGSDKTDIPAVFLPINCKPR